MPQAFSQSAQVRSSAMINRWISSLVFGSFSTIDTTTDLGSRERSPLCLMWGDSRRNSMARDRQRRWPRAVPEDASGPVRRKLPIQAPTCPNIKRPHAPGLTPRRSVASAPQPNRRIVRWLLWRIEAQKSPDVRRRYRVGFVEKQTPSCSRVHKMRSRDG